MAPKSTANDFPPPPLADYFFICGFETSQIAAHRRSFGSANVNSPTPPAPVETTIEEDEVLQTNDTDGRPISTDLDNVREIETQSKRLSYDNRKSICSIIEVKRQSVASSRSSSATIRAVPSTSPPGLSDQEFENVLQKFANERESFIEDIQFAAGAVAPKKKTRSKARTQRIISEETSTAASLSRSMGTLKRRISTMSSLKRPVTLSRQASIVTTRRLSGYKSVIPTPQPFHVDPNMHPLKRRYEPVLLDRYPPLDQIGEIKRRDPFPDYVPMFTFPNDVSIVSADERPRSTWHGFAMTNGDGSKMYGICITIWLPLEQSFASDLEVQCEEWRKANMSSEERELAGSLGERVAFERAKLSKLLLELPNFLQGSEEREQLEDAIGAVEERISLITEMLHPIRHGAASKIEGLTESETGLWIPRAFGVMGRDGTMTGFWKEWLKAVVTPMLNGTILRVPASSPRIGIWQPLERYVVNFCAEAVSPKSSLTQVEIAIRELKLYARKEASNELPGSRTVDLYALFRCLSLPNIITLFEYVLSESRVILLSSHTSMLHLASAAITNLLYPLQWAGVFIPVLPARLLEALEAPCPYIVGIERRYENLNLPSDDFVLVDLDEDTIDGTVLPPPLPRQQRRKLSSLLHLSASHHTRYGVPIGPPAYAKESFPGNAFASEHQSIFNQKPAVSTLAQLVSLNSTSFADSGWLVSPKPPIFNAFLQARATHSRGFERPQTSSMSGSSRFSVSSSPKMSPVSLVSPALPTTPISRSDSGFALQVSLREKRSGHFDDRRSSSFGYDRLPQTTRRPSQPFIHGNPLVPSTLANEYNPSTSYAPSIYAQSTLAASTIMPGVLMQPARNSETVKYVEGHRLEWRPRELQSVCSVCDEKPDDGVYQCSGCSICVHSRCTVEVSIVCPSAFQADQVRAAFVRCFASLLYTHRRFLGPVNAEQKRQGMIWKFNAEAFQRSLPHEAGEYIEMLLQTQAFSQFLYERETTKADDASIKLFDQIILCKRNRGRTSLFSKSSTSFLTDTTDHIWRTAAATPPNARFAGDARQMVTRIPVKLDAALLKEPRTIQGVPRLPNGKAKRKPVNSILIP